MFYFPRRNKLPTLHLWGFGGAECKYTPGDCFDPAVVERIKETIMSFKAQNVPRLVHLQHLPEESVVGCSLIRIYKECARATLAQNFTRSKQLESFLASVAWEKLNTGYYEEVDEAWRVFYTIIMMCRAVRLKLERQIEEALFACDMGLIMGRDVDGFALSNFAHHLHSSLSEPTTPVSLKTQKLLQPPPPLPNSIYVDVCELPSFEEMLKIIRNKKPVVIKGLVNQWPAFRKWNFSYFNELIGHRTVPIEIGNSYADNDWQQVLMTFRTFIQKFIECEIVGRKFLRIIPATETENMYPRQDGILTSTSQIDVRCPDLTEFPRFREAHVFDCTLCAGDCLFIPAGFWHYVFALDPSISVSCWFTTKI
ncbi:unnamed protein product [Wuchereria bancrofti]|uniref:JmjC domain-containing protein n=1 Tax=Wuchereria bancrofti TaxID=6293 RepID=A0A3P7F0X2_WUCBA|nr:unnamed protein product [Wuchereria bancrofti]